MKSIYCFFFGHVELHIPTLEGHPLIHLKDSHGISIVRVYVCKRCGKLFTNLEAPYSVHP